MTAATISRARAGDQDAFRELTDPYRRELQVHCYRILGSVQDAEDMLQETLLAAWRGLDRFGGRASMGSWLYKIATHAHARVPGPRGYRRLLPEPHLVGHVPDPAGADPRERPARV